MTISGKPSKTDWERVRKSIATDALIPYDPNDDEAVESFLTEANRINPARHTDEPPISKAS
jgi:ribosomal protein S18